ncbi:MAG: hypothetical protein MJ082_05270 [Clostridia bacterium]|nr:hypothetical protein [Clostridia bacterium]
MKKTLACIFLALTMFLSVAVPAFAAPLTREEASAVTEKDEVVYQNYDGSTYANSAGTNSWNKVHPNYSITTTDPTDPANKVASFRTGANGGPKIQKDYIDVTAEHVLLFDVMLPAESDGILPTDKFTCSFFKANTNQLVLQSDGAGMWNVTFFGENVGKIGTNQWLRVMLNFKPGNEDDGTVDRVDVTLSGPLTAQVEEQPVTVVSHNVEGTDYTIWYFEVNTPDKSKTYAALMDNVLLYRRGNHRIVEFDPEEPTVAAPEEGYIMPDLYNTGTRIPKNELVPIAEKYPEIHGTITDAIAEKYGYEFYGFTTESGISVDCSLPVTIRDCFIDSKDMSGVVNKGEGRLTVTYITGTGSTSAFFNGRKMTISHCYLYDVGADHMKAAGEQLIVSNYFRDGGTRCPDAHADVIQFSGSTTRTIDDVRVLGNRFDIPHLFYDHVANSCFFFKPERNILGFTNVQADGNWFNGGGYTTYLAGSLVDIDSLRYINYTNNKFGYGHNFATMAVSGFTSDANGTVHLEKTGGSYVNNGYVTTLEAGSIVYYRGTSEDGTRVQNLADLAAGSATVLVNFANYMTMERNYTVLVALVDADGKIVARANATDSVRRYTPVKEYKASSNLETFEYAPGKTAQRLIHTPDFPVNVPVTLTLNGLPEDLTGYSLAVEVYDTTNGGKLIRSSKLTDTVTENGGETIPAVTHTVTFLGTDGKVLKTETVKDGKSATAPNAEESYVPGFRFLGWNGTFTNVTEDQTVTAQYEEIFIAIDSAAVCIGKDVTVKFICVGVDAKNTLRVTMNGTTEILTGTAHGEEMHFVYSGISPQMMGDTLCAELLDKTGNVLDRVENFSVRSYCQTLLSDPENAGDTALLTIVSNLLQYGAASQLYTGYKITELVTAGVSGLCATDITAGYVGSTAQKTLGTAIGDACEFISGNLYFADTNSILFTFRTTDISKTTIRIGSTGYTKARSPELFSQSADGNWVFTVPGICATDFDKEFTARISVGTSEQTVVYSVNAYIAAMQNNAEQGKITTMAALARALYVYGLSAEAYAK